jgi:hypothetical protein
LKENILRKNYGPFKEIYDTWRFRRNNELYHIIGNRNIVNFIRLQRLRWFGHVYRMNSDRLIKGIYKWKPLGMRAAGRPKNKWEDDVTKDLKLLKIRNWIKCIQN